MKVHVSDVYICAKHDCEAASHKHFEIAVTKAKYGQIIKNKIETYSNTIWL